MEHEYASAEELYFAWYLKELTEKGYIEKVRYQPKKFDLFSSVDYLWTKQMATKTKKVKASLLRSYSYQADFMIIWNQKAIGKICQVISVNDNEISMQSRADSAAFLANRGKRYIFSVADVKGTYSQNDAYRRFSIDQKMVWDKYRIYVQKIITAPAVSKSGAVSPKSALFHSTFTPKRYFLTDKSMKKRKIRFPAKTIDRWLEEIE